MPGNVCTQCKVHFFVVQEMKSPDDAIPRNLPLCPLCKRPFCEKDMPNHKCKLLNYKMVILVRKDLNMTPGKVAAQAVHAGIELVSRSFIHRGNDPITYYPSELFKEWYKEGGRVVILAVEDLDQLDYYFMKAAKHDLPVIKYADGGITEVNPGEVTVLGIGPAKADDIDIVTGGLQPL